MYVSHPVRRLRENPDPDEAVTLAVGRGDVDSETFATRVEALGGDVVERGRFSTVVRLPETAVDDLCTLEGLERVETAETLGLGIDADVDVGEEPGSE